MKSSLSDKIHEWNMSDIDMPPIGYPAILTQLEFLAHYLFASYEPAINPNYPEFLDRLNNWLENTDDKNYQRALFQLVPHLIYIGYNEFNNLYRTALNSNVAKWLIDKENIQLNDLDAHVKIVSALKQTWFCPFTDSMRINAFYHINNIHSGFDFRPDWRSLKKFGDETKISNYISSNGIKYLVLLEDFVGTGSQISKAAIYAKNFGVPVLVLPLIVCPLGVQTGEAIQAAHSSVSFSFVVKLPDNTFIGQNPSSSEATLNERTRDLYDKIRTLVISLHETVCGEKIWPHSSKPYGPFGFGETGGTIVMYSNCPDNTLPIIHHKYDTWRPLFPRSTRV